MYRAYTVAYRVGMLIVYGLLIGGCASLPSRFEPQTPDQQAIARTMEMFFAATQGRDFTTITSLLSPDATFDFFDEGTRIEQEHYGEGVRQRLSASDLLAPPSPKLVNFKQPAATNASIEAYIFTDLERGKWTRTTQLHWDLIHQDDRWQIAKMVTNTSLYLNTPPPAGP